MPSSACLEANAHALGRYAALCQEAGLVPIVEPEVLMAGDHAMAVAAETTEPVLLDVFRQLHAQGVLLEAVIVKPNMVAPGASSGEDATAEAVADATIQTLLRAVPGIAFLSGGQSPELASARLNAMHAGGGHLPWALTFSFARAIQQPALAIWLGQDANVAAAQQALYYRAKCTWSALSGRYHPL